MYAEKKVITSDFIKKAYLYILENTGNKSHTKKQFCAITLHTMDCLKNEMLAHKPGYFVLLSKIGKNIGYKKDMILTNPYNISYTVKENVDRYRALEKLYKRFF